MASEARQNSSLPAGILAGGIGILALLFLMLPAIQPLPARRMHPCKRNLRQIAIALHNYLYAHDTFPAAASSEPPVSWRIQLLPYLDRKPLFTRYDQQRAWDAESNHAVAATRLDGFACPLRAEAGAPCDDSGRYFTDYSLLTGADAFADKDRAIGSGDLKDGFSNTLAVVEASGMNIVWTEPRDADCDTQTVAVSSDRDGSHIVSSFHSGGANAAFADGSVRYLNEDIDPRVLKALTTIAGGEPVDDF
jgi:prepilin-type processing-associated H-X9-DG protein